MSLCSGAQLVSCIDSLIQLYINILSRECLIKSRSRLLIARELITVIVDIYSPYVNKNGQHIDDVKLLKLRNSLINSIINSATSKDTLRAELFNEFADYISNAKLLNASDNLTSLEHYECDSRVLGKMHSLLASKSDNINVFRSLISISKGIVFLNQNSCLSQSSNPVNSNNIPFHQDYQTIDHCTDIDKLQVSESSEKSAALLNSNSSLYTVSADGENLCRSRIRDTLSFIGSEILVNVDSNDMDTSIPLDLETISNAAVYLFDAKLLTSDESKIKAKELIISIKRILTKSSPTNSYPSDESICMFLVKLIQKLSLQSVKILSKKHLNKYLQSSLGSDDTIADKKLSLIAFYNYREIKPLVSTVHSTSSTEIDTNDYLLSLELFSNSNKNKKFFQYFEKVYSELKKPINITGFKNLKEHKKTDISLIKLSRLVCDGYVPLLRKFILGFHQLNCSIYPISSQFYFDIILQRLRIINKEMIKRRNFCIDYNKRRLKLQNAYLEIIDKYFKLQAKSLDYAKSFAMNVAVEHFKNDCINDTTVAVVSPVLIKLMISRLCENQLLKNLTLNSRFSSNIFDTQVCSSEKLLELIKAIKNFCPTLKNGIN